MAAYKRVVLKLSGEALAGGKGFGIDAETVQQIALQIKSAYETDKNTQQNTESLISQYDTTEQEPDNTDKFDIERAARRKKRLQEMKRRKKRQELIRRFFIPGAVILVICAFLAGVEIKKLFDKHETKKQNNVSDESANAEISTEENEQEKKKGKMR